MYNHDLTFDASYFTFSYQFICLASLKGQSRQSARLVLQSFEFGLERGRGGSQFGRWDRHCGTLVIYVLCASKYLFIHFYLHKWPSLAWCGPNIRLKNTLFLWWFVTILAHLWTLCSFFLLQACLPPTKKHKTGFSTFWKRSLTHTSLQFQENTR